MTFPCLAQVLKGHFGVVAPDVEVEDGKGKVSVGGGEEGEGRLDIKMTWALVMLGTILLSSEEGETEGSSF